MKKQFVGYITGGDGGVDYTVSCALALIEGGVDTLELGLPFSDPVGDGPVIQRASERALREGTTPSTLLKIGQEIRKRVDTPLILFSYLNPLLKMGASYIEHLKKAGFNALLVVDYPNKLGEIGQVRMASPSTSDERLKEICREGAFGGPFVYYVCQKGTTGIREDVPEDFAFHISRVRKATPLPIIAGFGIATRKMAEKVLTVADGFVVGSAFVKLMEEGASPSSLKLKAMEIDPRGT